MKKYMVIIMERERGWGQDEIGRRYFHKEENAKQFITDYNAQNPPRDKYGRAPDCYIQAEGPYAIDDLSGVRFDD